MALSRILYFRDITQQTELDQIKSEFLSTAAHELRTPMASILGFSEVLLKTQVDESTSGEFLGIIYEQSNNMARILDELLDLARMEARRGKDFKLARIDLGALIADVVRSYKYPPGRPTADVDLPASSLTVTADAGKLRQALLNVLSNAYKYSPDGGPVLVSANSVEHQGCLMACIKIADRGLGMTEEQVRHVCERFYRADKSGKLPGSGLGMSIVKEIVELHGGTLSIASVLGQGSTISLFVPMDRLTVPPAGLALSAATT
jgi:signal transduction histidine kinase